MRDELLALAERCEAAQKADHGVSKAISQVVGSWVKADGFVSERWPHYTASLDAAMTLVPDGYAMGVQTYEGRGVAAVNEYGIQDGDWHNPDGLAATPALALCAAALRARAALIAETNNG